MAKPLNRSKKYPNLKGLRGAEYHNDGGRVPVELVVFVIIWAILVLGVFMDVREKLFGRRRNPDHRGVHHRRRNSGGQ